MKNNAMTAKGMFINMGYVEDIRALIGRRRIVLNASIVIIRNGRNEILLQHRVYPPGKLGLPGGIMELGESTEETARREVLEETGLVLGRLSLIGVYSGKDYLCVAQNGDEWYSVTTAYATNEFTGKLSVNDNESVAFEWFDVLNLPDNIAKTQRSAIDDYLSYVNPRSQSSVYKKST